ncbi:MAG: hypothetical protein ACOX64_09605 [Candidatus Merdivicinus sp.]
MWEQLKHHAGWLMAAVVLLFYFLLVGAAPQVSAEGRTVLFAQQVSSAASENPFEGSTNMRVYWEALEIVGETPLDSLTDAQKVQLTALGIPEEQLPEFLDNLQVFLAEELEPSDAEDAAAPHQDLLVLGVCLVLIPILLAAAVFLLVWFGRCGRFRVGKDG